MFFGSFIPLEMSHVQDEKGRSKECFLGQHFEIGWFVLRLGIKVDLRLREFRVVCVIVLSLNVGVNEQV